MRMTSFGRFGLQASFVIFFMFLWCLGADMIAYPAMPPSWFYFIGCPFAIIGSLYIVNELETEVKP